MNKPTRFTSPRPFPVYRHLAAAKARRISSSDTLGQRSECGKCGWVGETQTVGADCPECDHRTHPKRA